jgi:GDP-4-dehydro-6-deoxy-D-mannose reductase
VRALITGGRGFVGTWLARHLAEQGDEVVAIDKETDIADIDALAPVVAEAAPGVIYHLAALTHVGESWAHPEAVLGVNVLGTAAILAAARALPDPPTVLVVSSSEVYGAVRPEELPVTEDQPVAPVTPYAASKAAAEQVALQAWRGFGQAVIVARPFNHVGPGQADSFAVSALARRILAARRTGARQLTVGSLTPRRDFTDVRDVVRAYRLLVERGEAGRVYNVCSGRAVAISEIADGLLGLAGCQLELVADPALLRPIDVPVLRGDPHRLHRVTGWEPEISLEDTLADVLAYWEAEPDPA